jgi:hypothetical protein
MPKIALEVTPVQLRRAKSLVDSGGYDSLQQFAEIAFANQLALEGGADPEELAAKSKRTRGPAASKPEKRRPIPRLPKAPQPKAELRESDRKKPANDGARQHSRQEQPSAGSLDATDVAARLALAAVPQSTARPCDTLPTPHDQKLLALVNKPFALKLIARATLVSATKNWPRVEELILTVGSAAAVLGDALAKQDRAAERTRNLLHTGLPLTEKPESVERFTTQYIARVARSGQVTPGAIVQLSLAQVLGGRVHLSNAGVALARLRNPILDEDNAEWTRLLSTDEQRFLSTHISKFAPGEAHDARVVLQAIDGGHNNPEALLAAARPKLPGTWSDVQSRSYLSGLVTRLAELDALGRVWTGRTVHYELAQNAKQFLNDHATMEVA